MPLKNLLRTFTSGQLRLNLPANILGKGWTYISSMIFIPLYIKYLGMEAYGLVGFWVVLQSVFFLLDLGLSTTLNREVARLSTEKDSAQEMRDLVRSLEMPYWLLALCIAAVSTLLAPVIAHTRVNAERLSADAVESALRWMGIATACQFLFSLYEGGLLGLQRQVLVNLLLITTATVRGAGAVILLAFVSPTVTAFFVWQVLVGFAQVLATAALVWLSLPRGTRAPQFNRTILRRVWRFAAGMSAISLITILLTTLDRALLSKLLTLEAFGYYSVAATVAAVIPMLVGPFFTAVFPRLSQLEATSDQRTLAELYHKACQFVSVAVLPVTVVVACFSREILLLWTRKPAIADNSYMLVTLLVIGAGLNGLMNIPYALQLAHGMTKLAFWMNVFSVVFLVPMLFFLTRHYGAVGAGIMRVALNLGYVIIALPFMHRYLLKGQQWQWYSEDVGLPLLGVLLAVLTVQRSLPSHASYANIFAYIVAAWLLSALAAAVLSKQVRVFLFQHFQRPLPEIS